MKLTVQQPVLIDSGGYLLQEIEPEQIKVDYYAVLSIDGSTSNSGLAILRESDGALLYVISAKRDSNKEEESPVRYKIRLKKAVKEILQANREIQTIFYEEPCINYAGAVANLFMLRAFVEEMIIEEEPDLNYLKHYEISNKRWKKLFLAPDKCPTGTDAEKKAVRNKVEYFLPFLAKVSQDEIDAIAMGFAAIRFMTDGQDAEELESKKRLSKFQYNIQFLACDNDDNMLVELFDVYKGPELLLQNGICITEIDAKTNFDKHVYKTMGPDDKLLVIKFSSKHHQNLVLQYKIGNLSAQYPYIYALVWRKSRKKMS
jgi:Holliday junction resolvasome RuvABC endonuclease subunit